VPGEYSESLAVAERQFEDARKALEDLLSDLAALERELESLGAPWTPGRMPQWESTSG
jgi:hypothetical protein